MARILSVAVSLGLIVGLVACSGADSQRRPGAAGSATDRPVTGAGVACHQLSNLPEGRIAYTQTREDGTDAVFLMKPNGTDRRCLVETAGPDSFPAWSPDGRWVAFVGGTADGQEDVYVVRADGTELRQLTDTDDRETDLAWSPDGARIGYTSEAIVDGPTTIRTMSSLDGSGDTIVVRDNVHSELQDWSWEKDVLLFGSVHAGRAGMWTVKADGTRFRFLRGEPGDFGGGAVYSPNGRSIVFQADLNGGCIYKSDAAMQQIVRLTQGCSEGFILTWSPDGQWIAWAGGPHGPADAQMMAADGSQVHTIADGSDVAFMAWQPATDH